MFVHLAIHNPQPGKEGALLQSLHRMNSTIFGLPGLVQAHTLRDKGSAKVVRLTIWDSPASWRAAAPAVAEAVKAGHFEQWETEPPLVLHLDSV